MIKKLILLFSLPSTFHESSSSKKSKHVSMPNKDLSQSFSLNAEPPILLDDLDPGWPRISRWDSQVSSLGVYYSYGEQGCKTLASWDLKASHGGERERESCLCSTRPWVHSCQSLAYGAETKAKVSPRTLTFMLQPSVLLSQLTASCTRRLCKRARVSCKCIGCRAIWERRARSLWTVLFNRTRCRGRTSK